VVRNDERHKFYVDIGDLEGGGTTRADTARAAAAGRTVTEFGSGNGNLLDTFLVGDLASTRSSVADSSFLNFFVSGVLTK